MDYYVVSAVALGLALPILWWLLRRQNAGERPEQPAERLDTLVAWPPEATRILRSAERLAYSTLKLALPGYMILAQVPIARFLNVPKRNSYAEWMRRLGSQCVDFVVCDVTSQVIAVVEIRPPVEQISEKIRARLDRVSRVLEAAQIPLHVWNEERLPSIEAARAKILPHSPAVPPGLAKRAPEPVVAETFGVAAGAATVAIAAPAMDPFADTDRDWSKDEASEVIEVREPAGSTWFDELEETVSAELPPPSQR